MTKRKPGVKIYVNGGDNLFIRTFGTSAGTEPFAGFHHACFALETDRALYFVDAGECGAYTAHINGTDLLKTRAVFITHTHFDHVGGLASLLWYIRKLGIVRGQRELEGGNIDIFIPRKETFNAVMQLLKYTEGDFECPYTHTYHPVRVGPLYTSPFEELEVFARPTSHMPAVGSIPASYSYTFEAEGKTIVFSGDMRLEDIPGILPSRCDAFLVETGHHSIEDICEKIKSCGKQVGALYFVHHGGYIMRDPESALARAKKAFPGDVFICSDGEGFSL